MALLQDLIKQIDDPTLRDRIMAEANKLNKQKKFGLVFEEHLPECTPLYDVDIKVGSKVALKTGQVSDIYVVRSIDGDKAVCEHRIDHAEVELALNDLVAVAEFGEPIYPYLKPIDSVCNAPDSDLWHTLIEADNYHALQLLEYLYAGKVDCIYIDPPYNTGATDWKYNNNYVEETDQYRHSKWLSMMEKRLRLAKKLLNPNDSALIIAIDDNEINNIGCLIKELFPYAKIQIVSTVINHASVAKSNELNRNNEYIYFIMIGNYQLEPIADSKSFSVGDSINWRTLRRGDIQSKRGSSKGGKSQFYPIYVNIETSRIVQIGEPLAHDVPSSSVKDIPGCATVLPIRDDGLEMNWGLTQKALLQRLEKGYVKVGSYTPNKPQKYVLTYLTPSSIQSIEDGRAKITGYDKDGSIIAVYDSQRKVFPKTQWDDPIYDGRDYGSKILKKIIGKRRFDFPKSIYAVRDCLKLFVANKHNALIIDFFAGSGTTLHAVNLLNAEDNGKRRCILVTNNEVSAEETEVLIKKGLKPSDSEWEKMGIAEHVTWPRTVCSIEGHDVNGNPLSDVYITSETTMAEKQRNIKQVKYVQDISELKVPDIKQLISMLSKGILPQTLVSSDTKFVVSDDVSHTIAVLLDDSAADSFLEALDEMDHITDFFIITKNNKLFKQLKADITELLGNIQVTEPVTMPMADGFKANAAFFKLGFLDKASVRIGRQFREMLPTLWMKAGCYGACPTLTGQQIPEYMVLPKNHMAILIDNCQYAAFANEIENTSEIETVYLVTDSDADYRSMAKGLNVKYKYQLYRDYLDNFRINSRR